MAVRYRDQGFGIIDFRDGIRVLSSRPQCVEDLDDTAVKLLKRYFNELKSLSDYRFTGYHLQKIVSERSTRIQEKDANCKIKPLRTR